MKTDGTVNCFTKTLNWSFIRDFIEDKYHSKSFQESLQSLSKSSRKSSQVYEDESTEDSRTPSPVPSAAPSQRSHSPQSNLQQMSQNQEFTRKRQRENEIDFSVTNPPKKISKQHGF